jgi:sterol desaturase/sphingolipid hydroxylase (fatty acid hydroxylase superfamily)
MERWISEGSWLDSVLGVLSRILMPPFMQERVRDPDAGFGWFALTNVERIAHTFFWYFVVGMIAYWLTVRWFGKSGVNRFTYALPIEEPGQKQGSFWSPLKYLVPKSFVTHPSFKIDLMWMPFGWVLSFLGLFAITLGTGTVAGWLTQKLGPSLLAIPDGALSITLQVVIILLGRDLGRFAWHYQGHAVPFFWEFHKGHHSAEVLHPFGVRTHPIDMIVRNTYMGAGGGLIAGTAIYLLGLNFSLTAASYAATVLAVFQVAENFEHSHISISFGKTLDRFFYAPYMHHFHHGALERHYNKNLGIVGGLTLWDYLCGTLYRPTQGELIVWGASMDELGEKNPHRTLWGFFWTPFVEAFKTLRRRPTEVAQTVSTAT